jgi:predicted DNA-binding transcriptional regulator YafY
MQKRNTNKHLLFKLSQLEFILRGTTFRNFKYLEDALKISQRTIQRRIVELNKPKGKVQERFNPINKKDKEFRIFDPANNSMPLFSQDEIFEIWDKVVYKNEIDTDINRNTLDKILKIISMRSSDTGPYKEKYHKIEKAISNTRKVEFEYKPRNAPALKSYIVTPVSINYDHNKLYVYYPDRDDLSEFFIDGIKDLKISTQKMEDFSKWTPKDKDKDIFGFSMSINKINVEIEMDTFAKNQLIGQFRSTTQYIEPLTNNPDKFILKMPVGDIAPIGRFIFGLISRITILGDKKFKTELNDYYNKYVEAGLNEIKKQWD